MLPLLLERLPTWEPVLADAPGAPLHFLLLLARALILGSEGRHWISAGKGSESQPGQCGLSQGWEPDLVLPVRNRTPRSEAIHLFPGEVPRGVPSSEPLHALEEANVMRKAISVECAQPSRTFQNSLCWVYSQHHPFSVVPVSFALCLSQMTFTSFLQQF